MSPGVERQPQVCALVTERHDMLGDPMLDFVGQCVEVRSGPGREEQALGIECQRLIEVRGACRHPPRPKLCGPTLLTTDGNSRRAPLAVVPVAALGAQANAPVIKVPSF